MEIKPHIKRMFPGANTYLGFYSHYSHMIEGDARQIYVIKGGPGVGKSTFMKKIGQDMLQAGYDIEYHCCSSDNNSIDGLVIPALNTALLDGTAPHVVDPKNPGAVDEIINLGEYWDKEAIRNHKKHILTCNRHISRCFQCAYFALKEAKIIADEWEFYLEPFQDWNAVQAMYRELESKLFDRPFTGSGKIRRLFAWAHTPQGRIQYIDSLLQGIDTLYLIKGQPGTGKSSLLAKLADRAHGNGADLEVYHSPLDPEKLDLVIFPELAVALAITSEQYPYIPEFKGHIVSHNLDSYLDQKALANHKEDIDSCRLRFNQSLERVHSKTLSAKSLHDQLETYYIPAMNFAEIEKKRQEVVWEILNAKVQ